MVCLIFIFLTPKSWFDNGERASALRHQSAVQTLLLGPEVVANETDTANIEQQVKTMSGRAGAKVLAVRKLVNAEGRTVGFEVDIQ